MTERAAWISELSKAPATRLEACFQTLRETAGYAAPRWRWMRRPEIGLAMTRGRAGGDGAAFNLGEATVTRCALRLESGEEGVSYALGRDKKKAETAALIDALMQTGQAETVRAAVITPLKKARLEQEAEDAARAAATKVEFFTLVRGEDA